MLHLWLIFLILAKKFVNIQRYITQTLFLIRCLEYNLIIIDCLQTAFSVIFPTGLKLHRFIYFSTYLEVHADVVNFFIIFTKKLL